MRALVIVAALLAAKAAHADVLHVGEHAAELDVATDAAGKPFKLAALHGQWFVLTVGAAWCAPCKKELPIWDRLAGTMRGQVAFVAVSVDDDPADGKKFHARLGLANMRLAYLPAATSAVAARYGSATMPSTFVVDPSGVVRLVKSGFDKADGDAEYRALKTALEKLVPPPPDRKLRSPDPPGTELQSPPARHTRPPKDPDDDRSGEVLPPEHVSLAPLPPPPPPTDEPAFERGFIIDIDGGVGATSHGGVLSAALFPGYAVTLAAAIGARFGAAAAKTDQPGAAQLGFAALAATYEYRRIIASAGVGAGVVDQHGGFAWDARATYDAYHWGANHLVVGLAITDVGGKEGVALFEFVVGLHHR